MKLPIEVYQTPVIVFGGELLRYVGAKNNWRFCFDHEN